MSGVTVGIGTLIGGAVGAAGIGAGLYESTQQAGIENKALSQAQQTQQEQQYYNSQLMQLMANPSTFLNSGIFQGSLNQGLSSANRSLAAQGYLGSGNEATALEQYGQSQSLGALFQQEGVLGGLTGLNASTSAGQSLQIASGAQSQSFNQLGSVLASLGYATGNGNSGFSGFLNNATGGVASTGYTGAYGNNAPYDSYLNSIYNGSSGLLPAPSGP